MDFYYKNIKREHNDFPHTFSPITSSLTSVRVNMQMNKHYFSALLDKFSLYLVAILCRGGFQLVPGVVLWLVAVVVVG